MTFVILLIRYKSHFHLHSRGSDYRRCDSVRFTVGFVCDLTVPHCPKEFHSLKYPKYLFDQYFSVFLLGDTFGLRTVFLAILSRALSERN